MCAYCENILNYTSIYITLVSTYAASIYKHTMVYKCYSCVYIISLFFYADRRESSRDGSIVGGVLAVLFVISLALVFVVIAMYYFTKRKIKQKKVEQIQKDIFRRYVYICLMWRVISI